MHACIHPPNTHARMHPSTQHPCIRPHLNGQQVRLAQQSKVRRHRVAPAPAFRRHACPCASRRRTLFRGSVRNPAQASRSRSLPLLRPHHRPAAAVQAAQSDLAATERDADGLNDR
eukprot:363221-Chlamydomonas_euryale.AAC.16